MECFLCRQKGHSVQNCPRNTKEQSDTIDMSSMGSICFRCGSLEHILSKCPQKINTKDPLPFSTCFICKQKGHLVGQCPENEHGVYPNGGCCKFCGSVRHLASDCQPTKQDGTITLGKMDLAQGGDDDDVFLSLDKMQQEKNTTKPIAKPRKKVVTF